MTEFYIVTPVRTVCNKWITLRYHKGNLSRAEECFFFFFFPSSTKQLSIPLSPGPGCGEVNLLRRSLNGALLWICD